MKKVLTVLMALALVSSTAFALPITLHFDNSEVNLGGNPNYPNQINLTNQFAPFGISFVNVYRYIDFRDPFVDPFPFPTIFGLDNFGVSNGFVSQNGVNSVAGTILLAHPSPYFGFDWWTLSENELSIEGYDENGIFQDGLYNLGGQGSNTLSGNISYLQFHDNGGSVQLANVCYDSPVPEPATLMLLGSGLLGMGGISAFRFRRKK